jgi:putative tryptophan/tyrosine transport system substrate-binding protein
MNRRLFLAGVLTYATSPLHAQPRPQIRRVAIVGVGDVTHRPFTSLVRGLQDIGYHEGRNLVLLPGTTDTFARLGELAKEVVNRDAEVIVTYGSTATRAAKAATWSVPIVMVVGVDPIEHGFVRTYAKPEGNITGLANSGQLMSAKRLELLREVVPGIKRLGVLWSPESASQATSLRLIDKTATRMGITVHGAAINGPGDLKGAFDRLTLARVEAVLPTASGVLNKVSNEVSRLAQAHRMPTMFTDSTSVRGGGLISYGPDFAAQFYRAASYVDRILKGAKPGDLAVEQPTKFELFINLKTATAIGIEIPTAVQFRADELIR